MKNHDPLAMNSSSETLRTRHLAVQLQSLRLRRGWTLHEVASRAGLSRTTLMQLEQERIQKPQANTLHRLARALEVSPEVLWPQEAVPPSPAKPAFPLVWHNPSLSNSLQGQHEVSSFDRLTNPEVANLAENEPEHFRDWTETEWSELYSTMGMGGALTREGVRSVALAINRKRKVLEQLEIVLETHLGEVAIALVERLFQMVSATEADVGPFSPSSPLV